MLPRLLVTTVALFTVSTLPSLADALSERAAADLHTTQTDVSISTTASYSTGVVNSSLSNTSSDPGVAQFIVNGLGGGGTSTMDSSIPTTSSFVVSTIASNLSLTTSASTTSILSMSFSTSSTFPLLSSTTFSSIGASPSRASASFQNSSNGALSSSSTSSNTKYPAPWTLQVTGSVSSCYSTLWNWYFASSSSALSGGYYTVLTRNHTVTYPDVQTLSTITAGSATTLCDGHPRAIQATELPSYTAVRPQSTTNFQILPNYTSIPCAIAPSDCTSLWSSYTTVLAARTYFESAVPLPPPCVTDAASSVPFADTLCRNEGDQIIDSDYAQLIYWPIRYTDASQQNSSAYGFCDKDHPPPGPSKYPLPSTASGVVTGNGPNTYVTAGVTITSPDVGIYFSNLYARPGCGTTVNTVFTMPASLLQSGRGRGVLNAPYHFDLNDLNWICEDPARPNATWTTQDAQGTGKCYQNVPAVAYFSEAKRYDQYTVLWFSNQTKASRLNIIQDYRPGVDLFATSFAFDQLSSIFGAGPVWDIAGVWDPPIALTPVSNAEAPTSVAADPTTISATPQQLVTPAGPDATTSLLALPATSQIAQPRSSPTSTIANDPGNATPTNTISKADTTKACQQNCQSTAVSAVQSETASSATSAPVRQTAASSASTNIVVIVGTASTAVTLSLQPTAQNADPAVTNNAVTQNFQALTLGGSTITAVLSGSDIVIGSIVLSAGGVTNIAGQQSGVAELGSSAITAATAVAASTATVGGAAVTISNVAFGTAVVNGQTLTQGQTPQTLANGQQVSLGSAGIVIGAGISATTFSIANTAASISISSISSDIIAVEDQTLTAGGAAKTLKSGQLISLNSGGVLIGSGTSATVLSIAVNPNAPSISTISSGTVVIGGQTLTLGGAARTLIDGQQVSLGSSGVVVGSGATKATLPDAGKPAVYTISSVSSGVVAVDGLTLTLGGAAKTLSNGQIASLGSTQIVVGTGASSSTLAIPSSNGNLIVVGSSTLTYGSLPGGKEILSNGQTSSTLSPGGTSATIGGQVVTAASTGLVITSIVASTPAPSQPSSHSSDSSKTELRLHSYGTWAIFSLFIAYALM